jgi:hypothetical protein
VLSFGLPTLAYVRVHCEVEAIGVMRGAASAGRMRSARKAALGSIVMEGRGKIQIKKKKCPYKTWAENMEVGVSLLSCDEIIDGAGLGAMTLLPRQEFADVIWQSWLHQSSRNTGHIAPPKHQLHRRLPLLTDLSSMSPHRDLFAHATDWKASAATCANARRSTLSAIMHIPAIDMLLDNSRSWHDR